MLSEVQLGVNYALLMSTNAGLWSYSIGDTVKFVSLNPFRIVVTGRIKHFISAFGEHVIAEEAERAMAEALKVCPEASLIEFTLAPQVNPSSGELPYHEWLVEFAQTPQDVMKFQAALEASMNAQNIYYKDLIVGKVLQPLKLTILPPNAFIDYMKSQGKLGGQNKVPRLANDRAIADKLGIM
jgi:hypothetical protein